MNIKITNSSKRRTEVKYQFGRNNRPQGWFDKREQVSHLRIPGSAELHDTQNGILRRGEQEAGKLLGAVADENGAHVSHSCLLYTLCSRLFTCYLLLLAVYTYTYRGKWTAHQNRIADRKFERFG